MNNKMVLYTFILGVMSGSLYFLLWWLEKPIMFYSKQGQWYFIIPIAIAFVFSLVHGAFTGYFWEALGIKAKSTKEK
ncbi:MAG: hypothetical protein RIT27_1122 [Pseudomonadota bacterium]|jgi:hypothetical protein